MLRIDYEKGYGGQTRDIVYMSTPHYTVAHFTAIVQHIAKFWQLIGAVPWYGSDLGYSYSL